jgi:hypothetical protein
MWCVAACAACLGIAVIGVGCGGEGTGDSRESRIEGTEPGDCEDGADNDADGLFDCADPSCEASPLCGGSGTGGTGGSMLCADVDCDDQNECTEDACNPVDGQCDYSNVAAGTSCDFGGLPGVCGVGACEDAMLCSGVDCDDQNECTTDTCDPATGLCDHANVVDLSACDFGGLPGICTAGVCEDAMLCAGVDCDDQNECTAESCDPADGECDYTNVTAGMTCDFGGLPGVCGAGVCEDAMLCAGVDCDDGNECTQDACDPMDGMCGHTNVSDGTTCDFGGLPGVCGAGVCEDLMLCAAVDCDDQNQCTEDTCDPMDGAWGYTTVTDGMSCDFGGLPGVCDTGACIRDCITSALCNSCPTGGFCDTNDDCSVGSVCIESGCDSLVGAPINQCVFAGGGACNTSMDCPNGRECVDVPEEGKRCVKTTPGCDTSFDCVLGFYCESGSCVDRRIPCIEDVDCPKNHTCGGATNSSLCLRIQTDCLFEFDCVGVAPRCEDIDGDGSKECAGVFDPNRRSAKRRAQEA